MKLSAKALHLVRALASMRDVVPDATWYSIKNEADEDKNTAVVMIYDEIGYGVSAKDFVEELKAITADNIRVHMNTPGGDYFDGLAIYNALLEHPANVTMVVDGLAASAGSFIAMAANHIVMPEHSQMMIHDAHGCGMGPADEIRRTADVLDRQSQNIARIYAGRTGTEPEFWRDKMKEETWLSAQEAFELRLVDEVRPVEPNPDEPTEQPEDDGILMVRAMVERMNLGAVVEQLMSNEDLRNLLPDVTGLPYVWQGNPLTLTNVSDTLVSSKSDDAGTDELAGKVSDDPMAKVEHKDDDSGKARAMAARTRIELALSQIE